VKSAAAAAKRPQCASAPSHFVIAGLAMENVGVLRFVILFDALRGNMGHRGKPAGDDERE